MAGIMDIFKNITGQAAPAAPAPVQPQNPDPAAFQGTPNSPTVNAHTVASPLDEFKDLVKVGENTAGKLPGVELDINKLKETVDAMDFGVKVDSDTMAKLASGDPAALESLLNRAAQSAFMRGAIANSTVSERLTHNAIEHMSSAVPQAVRNQGIQAELSKNPNFSHEATSPFVQQLAGLIAQNSPKATPMEVAEQTTTFLQLLAASGQAPQPAAQSTDWQNFFKTQ